MSLGYVKGKYWVSDDLYKSCTEWEQYKALIVACRQAGISFQCEFSYTTRRYMAEVITVQKGFGDFYNIIKHENAYDEHPMFAVTAALRKHPHNSLLVWLLCVELDLRVVSQKLLPLAKLEQQVDDMLGLVRSR